MEQLTSFMSSRGILKSCVAHNKDPKSSLDAIDDDLLAHWTPGGAIYVCTDALERFGRHFLPRLRDPFVLVSGDTDTPVGESLLAKPGIPEILASPLLVNWFAQNLATRRPQLRWLPIGLDYHTMWSTPGYWGIEAVSPIAQEHHLVETLAASPAMGQRRLAAYCNWHLAAHSMNSPDRRDCFEVIDRSVCYFEASYVPRASTWSRQVEFMFVVSPEGMGLDCHRTWEALCLGCIPIVKKNALSRFLEQFPVMILDDWRDLTRRKMAKFVDSIEGRRFDFSPLFREYWVGRIRGIDQPILAPMTLAEFRLLITRRMA